MQYGWARGNLARPAASQPEWGCFPLQVRGGLTEKVQKDSVVQLSFTDVGKLPPPVLQFADVTFGYSPDRVLYRNVSLWLIPATPPDGACCSQE